jgi:hypothetical protein
MKITSRTIANKTRLILIILYTASMLLQTSAFATDTDQITESEGWFITTL